MGSIENNQTENIPVYRIPDLRKGGLCPVCKQTVDYRKSADLVLQSYNGEELKVPEEICFCKTCHLFLLDRIVRNKIKQYWDYGYRALSLPIMDGDDLEMIKDEMLAPKQQSSKINSLKKHKKKWISYNEEDEIQSVIGFEVQRYNNQDLSDNPKELLVYPESFDKCVKCNSEYPTQSTLRPWTLSILIDDEHIIKIPGRMCLKCNNFYLSYKDAWKVEAILDFFSINEYSLNYILQIKTPDLITYEEDNSVILITVLEDVSSGTYNTIVITRDRESERIGSNFFYIGNLNTRRFLTQLVHDKQTEFDYDENKYKVLNYEFKWGEDAIIPAQIELGDNGGYYPGEDDSLEVVDVLLYSERSHMFELARATYDKADQKYYMDISAYREFSLKYGKPDIPFTISIVSDKEFGAEKSLLNRCGYNVNATDNLTTKERQRILADVIDLELMTPARIISFLEWVEKKHRQHIEACYKWEEDIAFVRDYKVNPQRFVVGELK